MKKNWLIELLQWLSAFFGRQPLFGPAETKGPVVNHQPVVTYVGEGPLVEVKAKRILSNADAVSALAASFGPLEADQKINIAHIVDAIHIYNMKMHEQIAYTFATVYHETKATWEPVSEAFWLSDPEAYLRTLRYYPYYGRGYSQLTWKSNYQRMSEHTGYDLVSDPDMAMVPEVAAEILVYGMMHGFSPRGDHIGMYINKDEVDWIGARRVVNLNDKAQLIASYAKRIFSNLIN